MIRPAHNLALGSHPSPDFSLDNLFYPYTVGTLQMKCLIIGSGLTGAQLRGNTHDRCHFETK